MPRVIAEVTIAPRIPTAGGTSFYVAGVEKILRSHNLKVMLTPMSTILEGELDEVLAAVREAHESPFAKGVQRVYTTLRIDDRRDKEMTMEGKMQAVEEKLAKL